MAPRKKRNVKAKNVKGKVTEENSSEQEAEVVSETSASVEAVTTETDTVQNRRVSPRQHKKFGKFRFLIEESQKVDSSSSTEKESDASQSSDCQVVTQTQGELTTKVEIVKSANELNDSIELPVQENVEFVETVNSDESIYVIQSESPPDCSEQVNEEAELSQQLTNLEVSSLIIEDCSEMVVGDVEIAECDNSVYLDTVESDVTVECVSEQQESEIVDHIDLTETDQEVVDEKQEQTINESEVEEQPETKPKNVETEACKILFIRCENIDTVVHNKLNAKNVTPKKSKPKNKKPPKTVKNKGKKGKLETQNYNSDGSTTSESSIRRSSRIKSISVLKQRSKGYGLVKSKTENSSHTTKTLDSDTSENSNSGHTDSEKIPAPMESPSILPLSSEAENKPVKVKSRWRRSSELEMSTISPSITNRNFPQVTAEAQVSQPPPVVKEKCKSTDQNEVTNRLKQFVHLKENNYLTERISCKEARKMTCDCFLTPEEIERGEYGCGEDCLNRLLMIECGNHCPVGDRCTNKRFQKSQFAPCEVFKTEKKGLGIRASADIPFGEFILEYVGEVLDPDEFENRASVYSKDKNQHYYFMSLRADAVIDATQKGNISRFINHSCDPNAETQKWTVNGELRIGFFSKRTILAGEEITFDYQFQRYGKEAQKCFCGTPLCRGWLGEEPDDEDDEDDEDEDEEEEEEEEDKEQDQAEATKESAKKDTDETTLETKVVKVKPVKKEKKKPPKRKPRKDIFEDLDLDEEIESLISTGLKNQAHTLKLSRLMVRAKEPSQRSKLLNLLRHGEFPCRRLFLDYHGLRLMHGWMTDAQHLVNIDKKFQSLRLEILQTLATLPIPNKTMLQDSKVLPTVEKWSAPEKEGGGSPLDSDSNSPKLETDNLQDNKVKKISTDTIELQNQNGTEDINASKSESPDTLKPEDVTEDYDEDFEIRKSVGMDIENLNRQLLVFPKHTGTKLVEELSDMFEDMGISLPTFNEKEAMIEAHKKAAKKSAPPPPIFNYEEEIVALALKLLEEWSSLKEVFRIPKKERIEQMKEHEREADRKYKALLGLEQESASERKSLSRYRYLQRHRTIEKIDTTERSRKEDRTRLEERRLEDRHSALRISKQERRQLFALRVEHEEEERRRKQQWRHREQCTIPDPRYADPSAGYQLLWNPQTGQWQSVSLPQQQPHYSYSSTVQPILPISQSVPHYAYMQQPALGAVPVLSQVSPQKLSQLPGIPQQVSSSVPSQLPGVAQAGLQSFAQPSNLLPMNPPLPSLPYQECIKEKEEVLQVKFMGPIPPPAKLPPKWKCAKDKYGRPYYYHIKIRKSQWEPPEFPSVIESQDDLSDSSSSSDSSSLSSGSSSEDSDSDDDMDDTKLLLEIRNKLNAPIQKVEKVKIENLKEEVIDTPSPIATVSKTVDSRPTSIDERLKEQFNVVRKTSSETPAKKRRVGLVQEIIISPRTEEDKQQFKEDLKRFKENKEKLKRQKQLIMVEAKKHLKTKPGKTQKGSKHHKITVKTKLKEITTDMNSEAAKKIKEAFRSNMASVMVGILNAYRKPECKEGRITNTEDFKHLARKLTHFVMLKEIKHCENIEELTCTESVKVKAKEFVRKYMSKFGKAYQRPKDEVDNF